MGVANTTSQPDETRLIQKASSGDLDAFNHLVLAHQDLVYHHAFALLKDRDSAEDAAQESFVKAFQHIAEFRGGSFRAWLLKIATNVAYDIFRQSHRCPVISLFPENDYGVENESPAWLAAPTASPEMKAEQNELTKELHRLLDELPRAFRSVIMLVDVYEFDYAEAAQTLGVPIGTVKSRLARARLQMQEKLRDSFRRSMNDQATKRNQYGYNR
ncbi:MAG: RNA polymerase sigma factor [Anaerolineales bacterium]|nr:MAG: RNA polymerase sigma factor [Anaerolineales bacterium]